MKAGTGGFWCGFPAMVFSMADMHQPQSALRDDRVRKLRHCQERIKLCNTGLEGRQRNWGMPMPAVQPVSAYSLLHSSPPHVRILWSTEVLPGVQTCPEFVLGTGSTCQQTGSGDGATVAIFICWQSRDSCCWNPSPSKGTSSSSSSLVMKYNSQIKRHPDLSPKPQPFCCLANRQKNPFNHCSISKP